MARNGCKTAIYQSTFFAAPSSYLLAFIFVTLTTSPPHFVQVGSFGPSIGQMWLPPEKGDTLKIVSIIMLDFFLDFQ